MEFGKSYESHETIVSRNLHIRAQLGAGMLPVLPFEKPLIERQLEAVKQEQDDMGRELSVVNHQSSETWHDNHAANEVERYSKVVHTKGTRLVETLSRLVEFDYPPEGDEVTLGSVLELRFGSSDEAETAIVTGTAREMEDLEGIRVPDIFMPITLQSPIGMALLGARAGDDIIYEVGGRPRQAHVLSVRRLEP